MGGRSYIRGAVINLYHSLNKILCNVQYTVQTLLCLLMNPKHPEQCLTHTRYILFNWSIKMKSFAADSRVQHYDYFNRICSILRQSIVPWIWHHILLEGLRKTIPACDIWQKLTQKWTESCYIQGTVLFDGGKS